MLAALSIAAAITVPNLVEARIHSNYSAAIGSLKAISSAQYLFREGDKDFDGVLDYGTLGELGEQNLVDSVLAGGVKQGYEFKVQPTSPFTWWAMARPCLGDDVYLFTNHTGVIYRAGERGRPMCPCEVGPHGEAAPAWTPLGQ